MHTQEVKRSGSPATVVASFLHFDLCFALWVLLGALGIAITKDLNLNFAQKGLMVAIPTLSGSLFRIVIGLLSDRFSGKGVGTGLLIFLALPLFMAWLLPINFPLILVIGVMLGTAGASFAVALPLASRWYPPSQQGLVLGIAAAGNIGSVIANYFAPRLAAISGWHMVVGFSLIPLALVLLAFLLLAKDNPNRAPATSLKRYVSVVKSGDLWWFCLFYSVTFGGFVGLGTFLPIFFNAQYKMSAVDAGTLTALAAFVGSTVRPLGGFLADRFGGTRLLTLLFALIGLFYVFVALLLSMNIMAWLIVIGVGCLGMGNGAVFQLVPRRFGNEIGIATGVTGALGGLGGFFLPTLLGSVKQFTGSFSAGLLILASLSLVALVALRLLVLLNKSWRSSQRTEMRLAEEQEQVA